MKKRKHIFKRIFITLLCLGIACATLLFSVNIYVKTTTSNRILSTEEASLLTDVDCILVLGCSVKKDGTPSNMLSDRLTRGIELYRLGAAPKLLMSGDHGRDGYNEVGAMKQVAVASGIASSDVFMDHAGFSTYESLYRAKAIFGADKILIVTQGYHLPRALYIATSLGIDAYGVSSDYHTYRGQWFRDLREALARVKDVGTSLFKPEPTYLGDAIPVNGDGDLTNDHGYSDQIKQG